MLKTIALFLNNLNPDIIVQAPARINLINPLDAVEGDFWMPSVAINGKNNPLSVFFYIKQRNKESKLKIYEIKRLEENYFFNVITEEILSKKKKEIKQKCLGKNCLIYASINRFIEMNSYFKEEFLKSNIEIGLITTIPPQSGLGGSAAIIIAILYGFSLYFNLYNNLDVIEDDEFPINKDIIAEMATKIEDEDLNITSGYGDRYVIARGGLGFCSYYGKLFHKKISKEPLAVYDKIDVVYEINDLPIIVCFSGVLHKSGNVHSKLREFYFQKNPKVLKNYREMAKLAWKSRFAIMRRDWVLLGKYFIKNTKLMNQIMKEAGFKYGIGVVNNILIKIIEEHPEVYAAKLTGAGNGGSVFALVNPNKIDLILNYWRNKLQELIKNKEMFSSKFPNVSFEIMKQLENAQFYQIIINKTGVKKL